MRIEAEAARRVAVKRKVPIDDISSIEIDPKTEWEESNYLCNYLYSSGNKTQVSDEDWIVYAMRDIERECDFEAIAAIDPKNYAYWQAAPTWEQMQENDGMDGDDLTLDGFRKLQEKYPNGFYIRGWKKENNGSEPDGYLEPNETKGM
jgi:hypothetical protein